MWLPRPDQTDHDHLEGTTITRFVAHSPPLSLKLSNARVNSRTFIHISCREDIYLRYDLNTQKHISAFSFFSRTFIFYIWPLVNFLPNSFSGQVLGVRIEVCKIQTRTIELMRPSIEAYQDGRRDGAAIPGKPHTGDGSVCPLCCWGRRLHLSGSVPRVDPRQASNP